MALKPLNSINGVSVSAEEIDVIYANGDVSAVNLVVSGNSNLGPVGNITITGGSNGQVLTTDGAGNLSFASGTSNSAAPMPYFIPSSQSYIVSENFQGLFYEPIDIEGEFEVDGVLIDVSGSAPALNANIANVSISGGTSGYVLSTNGSGTLSWVEQSGGGGIPGGNTTELQYNNSGVFGGLPITYDGSGVYANTPIFTYQDFSACVGNINGTIINATDVYTENLTATGIIDLTLASNVSLGSIANVHIAGGTTGQYLQTDGSGNLSWAEGGGSNANLSVTVNSFTGNGVQTNFPLTVTPISKNYTTVNYDGVLLLHADYSITGNVLITSSAPADGSHLEIYIMSGGGSNSTVAGSNTQVQYNSDGNFSANSTFTFNSATGTLNTPNIAVSGDIIPTANVTYSLGNATNRFANLYLAGNTIDLGGAIISANSTSITFTNPEGGTFAISGSSSDSNLGNIATANYFAGNGNGLSNIQGANVIGAVSYASTANAVAGSNVSGAVNLSNYAGIANSVAGANVTGAVAYASVANSVSAANISGAVALANYATIANSVVGSNVSGAVDLATYASTANAVAGANVTGAVNYATTANSIAGANVSGEVAYAATANSVAGSNVTGAVAYATTANSVAGANVSGEVAYAATANSVAGANVSGAVSLATYATTANAVAGANVSGVVSSATTSGTVTTAAQPNITSVGTLSSLDATGNITGGNLITTGTGNLGTLFVGSGGANINGYTKITGNIDVTGNFNVSGNLNYQNVTDLVVGDPLIYLAANAVGDTDDIGIVGNYNDGTYAHTGIARDHTDSTWKFFTGVTNEPTTTIDWANAQYPSVKTGNLFSANITGTGWANITGNILAGNANLGNAATANYFIGSGANLTSIVGANVSGAVAYATTANSVAGANVSGAVAYATTANSVAGANISGAVNLATYADTANSVAGANVSGAVAYATTANSVAGANVSGAVAYATTANSVAGANVSGAVNLATYAGTANAVAGANVSGTVSLASTATVAGTVTTAAQPNITSVGTLSSVAVTGNVTSGNVYANTGTIGASLLTGALTTAAQPNITSTGTLTALTVTGNTTLNSRLSVMTANIVAGGFNPSMAVKSVADSIGGGIMVEGSAADSTLSMGYDGTSMFISSSYRTSAGYKPIAFYTSGTQRVTITTDGNVGVGQTTPPMQLGLSTGGAVISGTATVGSNMRGIQVYNTTSATANNAVGLWLTTGPHQAGIASFRPDPDTTWNTVLAFYTHGASTSGLTDCYERGRFDGEGNLLIGYTSSVGSYKLQVAGNVYLSGTLTEASSIKLKENVKPITNALDIVCKLEGVTYDKKDGSSYNEPGFIAEKVAEVIESLIDRDENGDPIGVKYNKTIAYLVEAIKELKAEIDLLKGAK